MLVGSNPKLITQDSSVNKKQVQSRPDSSLKKYFNEFKRESLSQSFQEEDEDVHNVTVSNQKTSTTIESAQQHQQQSHQQEEEDVNKSFNYFEENNIEQYYEGYVHSEHSQTTDELNNTILNVNNILEGYHHHQADSLCEDDEQTRKFNEEDLTEATYRRMSHQQEQPQVIIEEPSITDDQTISEPNKKLEQHFLDNTETYDKESFNFHTELYITETDDDKTYQLDNTEFDDLNNKSEALLDETTTVFENNIEDTNQELVLDSTTFLNEAELVETNAASQFYAEETCQQAAHVYEETTQFNEIEQEEEAMQHQEYHEIEQANHEEIQQQQHIAEDHHEMNEQQHCEESVATVTHYDNNVNSTCYQEEETANYNYMDTYNYDECNESVNTSTTQTNQYAAAAAAVTSAYQGCGENSECHEEENLRKYKEFFEKQSYFIEDCDCNNSHHHHSSVVTTVEEAKKCTEHESKSVVQIQRQQQQQQKVAARESIDQKSYFADCNRGYKAVEEKKCSEQRKEEKRERCSEARVVKREETKKLCAEQTKKQQVVKQEEKKCTENKLQVVKQQQEEKKQECKEAMFKQSDFIFDKAARSHSITRRDDSNKKICLESMALQTSQAHNSSAASSHHSNSYIRKSTGDLTSISNYATFERELKSHQQQHQQAHKRFSEVKLNFSSSNLANNGFAAFDAKQSSFAAYSSNGNIHQAAASQEAKFATHSNNMFIGGHASRSYNSLINTNQLQQNHEFNQQQQSQQHQQQQQQRKTSSRQQNFFIDSECCDALIQNIAALHNAKKQLQKSERRISNLNTQISAKKSCTEISTQVAKGECVEVVHCVDKSNPNGYFFDMGKESDTSDDGVKRSYKIIFKKY